MKSFACLSSKVFCCIGSLFLALSLYDSAQANELIGHWKLDESSGSIAADSTTNGNSGTHTGAGITQSTDTKASLSCSNQASLSLSGQGGYINIPDDVSINPQQSFTIALWLNPNSLTTGYRHILFRKAVLTGLGIWANDGKIFSEVDFVDAEYVRWLTDTDVLTVNTWLHVAITYDSNTLRRYINGVQDKETSRPQKSLVYSSGQPLKLGAGDYNSSFDGYIDDVRLYDYGLSSSDVLDLALGGCDTDLEPDAFSFTDQTDVAVSTQITSNTITVAGITSAAAISVTGGEYAINGGSYTSDAGTVENGNTVTVRHTSSGSFSTATNTTLTISEVSDTFTSTTVLASQTINFGQPSDDEITMGSVTLFATASSGLAVAFASNTVDVCSVIGTTATYSAIGTCTIAASQAGNATYAVAPTVMRSFQITRATQTITFAQPSDDELTSSAVILSANASSGLPVSYSSNTPDICSVAGAQVSYIAIGACTITASQLGDNTYAAANNVTRSFSITDADSDEDGIGDSEDDFPFADTEETSGEVTLQTTPPAANSSCSIDSLAVADVATESPGAAVDGIGKGVSFALSGCDTSNLETLTISIDLGTAPAEGSAAMKIDSDGNWSRIEGSTIEGSVVTYTIIDNGPLDQDSDPGTMADPVTVAVPYSPPALPVPALPALLLGLLSLLLGLFGYRRLAH